MLKLIRWCSIVCALLAMPAIAQAQGTYPDRPIRFVIAFPPGGLPRSAAGGPNPMSDIARSRRAVWPDRETVRASYASRPPMNALEPDALTAYVRYGFRERVLRDIAGNRPRPEKRSGRHLQVSSVGRQSRGSLAALERTLVRSWEYIWHGKVLYRYRDE